MVRRWVRRPYLDSRRLLQEVLRPGIVHIVYRTGEHGDDDRLPPERHGVGPGQRRDEAGEAMPGAAGSGRSSRAPPGSPTQTGVVEEGATERCRENQRGSGLPREPRSPGLQRRPAGVEAQGGTVLCAGRERTFFPVSVAELPR
jgi:hypothetical protein